MYHTVVRLFKNIQQLHKHNISSAEEDNTIFKLVSLRVVFIEIYNECIRDLLSRGEKPAVSSLELKEDPKLGISVKGVTQVEVSNLKEVFEKLEYGNSRRTTETTHSNATSSRSHAILQIMCETECQRGKLGNQMSAGKLSLIDLAGSEKSSYIQLPQARRKEGAMINKSLLALSNCINVLSENARHGRKGHVPYRDSKLTRLLKDSLGGNSRTVMIANVSPSSAHYEETLNTLKYASRTKDLKTSQFRQVVNAGGAEGLEGLRNGLGANRELLDEVNRLRTQVTSLELKLHSQSTARSLVANGRSPR